MKIIGYQLCILNPNKTYDLLFYFTLCGAKRSSYTYGCIKSYISPVYEDHIAPVKYTMNPFTYKWTRLY